MVMIETKLQLYKYDELSKEVRQQIINDKCFEIGYSVMDGYAQDYKSTLDKFEELMGISVRSYNVDYCGYNFDFEFDSDELLGSWLGKEFGADDICGKYLRRYLNEFMYKALPQKRYIKYEAGYNEELNRWNKQRISRISTKSWKDCPLTGMCYDYDILKPIVDCLSKPIPDTYSLTDLVQDTLDNFFSAWKREYEYWCDNKDNCLDEELSNRYCDNYFYEDGTMYNGKVVS